MRSTFLPTVLSLAAITVLAAFGAGCAGESPVAESPAGDPASSEEAQTAQGRPGSHGMVLAGAPASTVLSHIPMFGNPHDVQLLVSGKLTADPGAKPLPPTFSDRAYTFLPERTSLDALRTGVTRELKGTVFLGNFEQGGRPVTTAKFAVDRVIHQHILPTGAGAADAGAHTGELTYVVFGSRTQAFAAHYIAVAPSFDEVLAVKLGTDAPSDADLARGVIVRVAGSTDVESARLGRKASATLTDGTRTFTITPAAQLSCLTGPEFVPNCQ